MVDQSRLINTFDEFRRARSQTITHVGKRDLEMALHVQHIRCDDPAAGRVRKIRRGRRRVVVIAKIEVRNNIVRAKRYKPGVFGSGGLGHVEDVQAAFDVGDDYRSAGQACVDAPGSVQPRADGTTES